jgi:exopolysaccharide biosynthesis protein
MDTSDGARAGFYSRKLHPNEMGFDFARAKYESAGKKVAIVVAAAFTSDWKSINGHAVEDGADVGSSWDINDGTVAIVGGLPEIIRGRESLAGKRKSSQEIMKQAGSMFQQFAAVSNSRPIHSSHFCIRTTPRFFVEFMRDGKSYFGVADFSRRMEINGAIDLLLKIGVKNAVYLDGGAVSQGYYY